MSAASWRNGGTVVSAPWPAAVEAGRLLGHLGACARVSSRPTAALTLGTVTVEASESSVGQDWASSGAMALTGPSDSPPLHAVGRAATIARAAALALELITGTVVGGPALLGERAALMGLTRNGQVSAGGGTRLLRAADGWWALNLARDLDSVPALLGGEIGADPWEQVARWAGPLTVARIIERTTILGMAAAALGETPPAAAPWRITRHPAAGPGSRRPMVVNLGALWAGPLSAHLLGLTGARVIHVESKTRPDPTRASAPEFFALLHAGHEFAQVDFTAPDDLSALLREADVVIEASRPRALTALGLDADAVMADGRPRTWLRMAGHRAPDRIAFGDDAAVSGGLLAWTGDDAPAFAGDAIADPVTGLLGALAVSAHLPAQCATTIDIAMADVAAYCASGHRAAEGSPSAVESPRIAEPRVADRMAHDMFAGSG